MSSPDSEIVHVSDTALMVAACRATESERPDGLIRDPFAARLAGSRGMAIANGLERIDILRLGVAIRTHFVDELVSLTIAEKAVRTVLSVGCGLDTRPWRLDLPSELRWIEVDFPEMLDYKSGLMAAETPRCRRETVAADLTDASERRAVFAAVGDLPALMITEGLLSYLPADTVDGLATDTLAVGVRYWLTDIISPVFAKHTLLIHQPIMNVRAATHLNGAEIMDTLRDHGWHSIEHRNYVTDIGFALERIQAFRRETNATEPPPRAPEGDPTGIHLFAA